MELPLLSTSSNVNPRIKHRAVSTLLKYNEKFEKDIAGVFQKRRQGIFLYLTIAILFYSYRIN